MSTECILLLDIGNTRVKWALTDGVDSLCKAGSMSHLGETYWPRALPDCQPGAVWVASVAAPELVDVLAQTTTQRWGLSPQVAQTSASSCGVRNAYPQPRQLGVDRWLACIGAHHYQPRIAGSTLIVDAGTALTLDLVAADGKHLGGMIATGVHTMRQAIHGDTQIRARQRNAPASWLADDTDAAVALGTLRAATSLIENTCAKLCPDRVLLTGGEASLLASYLPDEYIEEPELVLKGLARVARDKRSYAL